MTEQFNPEQAGSSDLIPAELSPVARAVKSAAERSRIYQHLPDTGRQFYDQRMTAIMEEIAQRYQGKWQRQRPIAATEWTRLTEPNPDTGQQGPVTQIIRTLRDNGLIPWHAEQVVKNGFENAFQMIANGVTSFDELNRNMRKFKSTPAILPGRQFTPNKVAPPSTIRTTLHKKED